MSKGTETKGPSPFPTKDIMVGTKIYEGIVYAYVTVIKANSTKDDLKYVDGYIDENTFQWETVANVSDENSMP